MRLYEISSGLAHIDNMLELGELDEQATQDAKEYLMQELKNKGNNIIALYVSIDSEIEAIEVEEKRLAIMKQHRKNKKESIKKLVEHTLNQMGIDKVVSPLGTISFRISETVEVTDISKIRSDLVRTTITQCADKVSIKQAIKQGDNIEGVEIKQHRHLQIK